MALRWPEVPLRYLSARKILNYYRAQFAWLTASERVGARPYQLKLELTNVCNLRCPKCPTGQGRLGRRASMMTLAQLREVLRDLAPYAFQADMHNWGESLLHKQVFEGVRLCEDAGVMTQICTNFNIPFDEETAEKMVRSGLSVLSVSIDGPDQKTYETYRVHGKLEAVLANVETLRRVKQRLNAANPIVIWNYLVFRFNENRVEDARRMAEQYGMVFLVARGFAQDDPEWETTREMVHPVVPMLLSGPSCRWLYSMAVVNADLGVSPCTIHDAFDSEQDFGDVREQSFGSVWNGERYRSARRLFRGLRGDAGSPEPRTVCEQCFVYTSRRQAGVQGPASERPG